MGLRCGENTDTVNSADAVIRDFGIIDEIGAGEVYTKTELKAVTRSGVRCLAITMTYGVGAECHWQTFNWLIDGGKMAAVLRDINRVILMTESGQGAPIWGRWISRLMAYDQGIRLLKDLGPVAFHDGHGRALGMVGEINRSRCFLYETRVGTKTRIQPFPITSLRAIAAAIAEL